MAALASWLESLAAAGIDVDKLQLTSLEPSIVHEFIQWLKKARKTVVLKNRKKKSVPRFRPATVQLYTTALLRAVRFWRGEGLIPFTAAREKAGARLRKSARRRRTNLPADPNWWMINSAN
jgi:hypothetical protein